MSQLSTRRLALGLGLILLAAPNAAAEPTAEEPLPGLTGSWGGHRERLHEAGFSAEGSYTLDLSSVRSGGIDRRSAARGLLDFGVLLDLESLGGLRGGTFYAGAHSFRGRNGSEDLGDFQGYSNIDAERFDALAEIWYEQRLAGDRFRLKAGSVDANTEFAFVGAAEDFINSSAGFSPTILTFPTYPAPEPSLSLFFDPNDTLHFGAGVFRSPLDGDELNRDTTALFRIGEIGWSWSASGRLREGRASVGTWHDSGSLARLDGGVQRGATGHYAVVEQTYRPAMRRDTTVCLFAQLGRAEASVGEAALHGSLGAVAAAVWSRRPHDRIGALLTFVDLSDVAGSDFHENEAVVELFYDLRVTRYLRLRPDLQYVANPAGDARVGNALVVTLRVAVDL